MDDIAIEQLRVPQTLTDPEAADFLRAVEVSRQVRVHTWGNDDLAYTGEDLLAVCRDPFEWYVMLAARLQGEIVGIAGIAMPLDDATDQAHVTLDVLPRAQGNGIGRLLLEAAETFVRGENRRTVLVETNHAAPAHPVGDEHSLPAGQGGGQLPLASRETQFAARAGYALERVEQFSVCALPLPAELIDSLSVAGRQAHGEAYTLVQWVDACPSEWAADLARLEHGELVDEVPEELARLRDAEALMLDAGRHTLVTAAASRATGRLVAFTSISVLAHRDDVVFQDDTVVESEHVGKELGLRIKVANLEQLAELYPHTRTIYTWNAANNNYLLGLNARLGYVAAGVSGQWHKSFNLV